MERLGCGLLIERTDGPPAVRRETETGGRQKLGYRRICSAEDIDRTGALDRSCPFDRVS